MPDVAVVFISVMLIEPVCLEQFSQEDIILRALLLVSICFVGIHLGFGSFERDMIVLTLLYS